MIINVSHIKLISPEKKKKLKMENFMRCTFCMCACLCVYTWVCALACLPGYMFIISKLPWFDAYLESNLISSGHYYMSGQEKDTHTRQRNIPGPGGAIYLSPSRFKILIKINLPQFTHSAICLFIRIVNHFCRAEELLPILWVICINI